MWYVYDRETAFPITMGFEGLAKAELEQLRIVNDILEVDPEADVSRIDVIMRPPGWVGDEAGEEAKPEPAEMVARAMFDLDENSILLQCGDWANFFGSPKIAAYIFWAWLGEAQCEDEPNTLEPREGTGWLKETVVIDNAITVGLDALRDVRNQILHYRFVNPHKPAADFLSHLSWLLEDEKEASAGDGYWVIDKENPFLFRWYEFESEANEDDGVAVGTHRVEKC